MNAWFRSASKEALQSLVFRGAFYWRMPAERPGIALTFDDGPHPDYTPAVLDLLRETDVRATFFLIGRNVEAHPALARRIAEEGHALGGHSYDHTVITQHTPGDLVADLKRCRDVLRTATGVDTNLMRPPKGEVNFRAIGNVCRAGYRLMHWSKTYGDYRQDGTANLLGRIDALPAAGRDILLFHDHNQFTLEALRVMIPRWRAERLPFEVL